jgi:hypothetical protein
MIGYLWVWWQRRKAWKRWIAEARKLRASLGHGS